MAERIGAVDERRGIMGGVVIDGIERPVGPVVGNVPQRGAFSTMVQEASSYEVARQLRELQSMGTKLEAELRRDRALAQIMAVNAVDMPTAAAMFDAAMAKQKAADQRAAPWDEIKPELRQFRKRSKSERRAGR